LQTNAVVAQGRAGVLLIDPGVTGDEMTCLANDLRELGQPVVAGFSTHPHWDHLLWHAGIRHRTVTDPATDDYGLAAERLLTNASLLLHVRHLARKPTTRAGIQSQRIWS
jgi:glyoxylase-like metal-dependent hydrolase (beta-lactamase superfamily II)